MNLGKVGIIFNGGGFLGAFSAGYIKALLKAGIRPAHIQGVSVGALNAVKLVIELENTGELEKIYEDIEKTKAIMFFNWIGVFKIIIRKRIDQIKTLWKYILGLLRIKRILTDTLNPAKGSDSEASEELEKKWLGIEKARASSIFNWKDIPGNIVKKSGHIYNNKGLLNIFHGININKIINSPIELQIVVHNESKGEREVFSSHDPRFKKNPDLFMKMILASASIPGLFPLIEKDDQQYSDGIYFSLESMMETGCDTIFLLLNDQFAEKGKRWDERMFIIRNFLYEELISSKINEALKKHPDFKLENEDWEGKEKFLPPLLKKIESIKQQIRSVASSIISGDDINLIPHRLIILNTRTPISTLHATSFEIGDIKAAIEQGYDQASVLLKKLGMG